MKKNTYRGLSPEGFHQLSYLEWGDPSKPTIIAVHGLLRNAYDFHYFATAMQDHYHIVAPHVVGRGDSAWLSNPNLYTFPQYLSDMNTLIARLNVDRVIWVGTSMGGLIGMMLAAQPHTPLTHLVLNDVGATVSHDALLAITQYAQHNKSFATHTEAKAFYRPFYQKIGVVEDRHLEHMITTSHKQTAAGFYVPTYDPKLIPPPPIKEHIIPGKWFDKILHHFDHTPPMDFSVFWEKIKIPVLILRGGDSKILTADTVHTMQRGHPLTDTVTFPGIDHAPSLDVPSHYYHIGQWLHSRGVY